MARRAREFVEARDWNRAGDQLEGALRSFLEHPRDPAALFSARGTRVSATLGGREFDRSEDRARGAQE
jgi:hypothetical protein